MRDEVRRDFLRSSRDFEAIVGPAILEWLGGGEIINLPRDSTSKVVRAFDCDSLVDAFHLGIAVRGIAYRIQYMEEEYEPGWWRTVMVHPWDTLTRRKRRPSSGARTESDKMEVLRAYPDEGWFWPAVTVQAYLKRPGGPVVHVIAVRTADLLRFHQEYSHLVIEGTAKNGGEEFYIYHRQDLVDAGVRVFPQELPPGLKVLRRQKE